MLELNVEAWRVQRWWVKVRECPCKGLAEEEESDLHQILADRYLVGVAEFLEFQVENALLGNPQYTC